MIGPAEVVVLLSFVAVILFIIYGLVRFIKWSWHQGD